jgi:hypothetical protein
LQRGSEIIAAASTTATGERTTILNLRKNEKTFLAKQAIFFIAFTPGK